MHTIMLGDFLIRRPPLAELVGVVSAVDHAEADVGLAAGTMISAAAISLALWRGGEPVPQAPAGHKSHVSASLTPRRIGGIPAMTKRAISRLTGISGPWGGVQWEHREPDRDLAARIVAFLEDRRVLYVPTEAEIPRHCIESVLEIRRHLTNELGRAHDREEIAATLRAMRASARKFLTAIEPHGEIPGLNQQWSGTPEWVFLQALGEMRGVFGVHLAILMERYDLTIEPNLASIMPADTEDDSNDWFFEGFQ